MATAQGTQRTATTGYSSSQMSQRQVLPSTSDFDTQLSMSAKLIGNNSSNLQGANYAAFLQEYTLLAEYNMVQQQQLAGIFVVPSAKSPLLWFAVIFIRKGMYEGGIFRFQIVIPEKFPNSERPKIVFDPPIFHPMINMETGEMDTSKEFPSWNHNVHHICQLLVHVRASFYKLQTDNPANATASDLFETKKEEFQKAVETLVKDCRDHLYDKVQNDDPHYICFSQYDEKVHESLLNDMKKSKKEEYYPRPRGLSWVESGSLKIFSRLAVTKEKTTL